MRFIYLLYKYDWHHVIDTMIQFYMIVGLGINFHEILDVNITLFASKAAYYSKIDGVCWRKHYTISRKL